MMRPALEQERAKHGYKSWRQHTPCWHCLVRQNSRGGQAPTAAGREACTWAPACR